MKRANGLARPLFKWLLIVLVVANVAVWTAWPFRHELVARGILAPPPVERVDLDPQTLPPIVERAEATPAADPGEVSFAGESTETGEPIEPGKTQASEIEGGEIEGGEIEGGGTEGGETEGDGTEGGETEGDGSTDPADGDVPSRSSPGLAIESPPAPQPTPTALLDCVVAGPVANLEAAETIATRLRAAGALVDTVAVAGGGTPNFLVYVEPAASRAGAWSVLRELQAQSIQDAEVLWRPPDENAVAVGVYSDRDRADARRVQVAALGYNVLVRERQDAVYRLRVRQVSAGVLGDLAHEPCGFEEAP